MTTNTGPRLPRHPSRDANTGTIDPAVLDLPYITCAAPAPASVRTTRRVQTFRAAYQTAWWWGRLDGLVLGCAGTVATLLLGRHWGWW